LDTLHYQSQTLVDVAYKALKKDITERAYRPGQKIIVRELHEKYGISETPIKQAINRLITEGLVESIPRKGIKVKDINREDIEELFDIRLMIESYYLKQILANFQKDADMRKKLAANLSEHASIIENTGDLDTYLRIYYLDQEFHQMIIKCSGNKKIIQIYNNLRTHDYAYYIYRRQTREENIAGVDEHRAIYDALVAQNQAELRKCIKTHIINARKKINKYLQPVQ